MPVLKLYLACKVFWIEWIFIDPLVCDDWHSIIKSQKCNKQTPQPPCKVFWIEWIFIDPLVYDDWHSTIKSQKCKKQTPQPPCEVFGLNGFL